MATRSVNIILVAVLSAVAANTCPLNPITCSCFDLPHLTLKFSEVTVTTCNKTHNKNDFKLLKGVSYTGDIDQSKTYAAVMVDPDAPGHVSGQAYLHWIHTGLTAKDLVDGTLHTGQEIMDYAPPTPPDGTGTHRYFVFLFKETKPVKAMDTKKRAKFLLSEYAARHQLCGPVAFNMFQTQY